MVFWFYQQELILLKIQTSIHYIYFSSIRNKFINIIKIKYKNKINKIKIKYLIKLINLTFDLNDLLIETSKGCNWDVNPSGIIAILVFFSLKCLLTELTIYAENESKTNNDYGLESLSACLI